MSVQNTSSPLNGPEESPRRTPGPELKKCDQCGRIGTRLFQTHTAPGIKPITVCMARAACRKRWPKPTVDEAA